VQVNASCFRIGVSEQHLDGCQIRAVLQQVRGKAVAQHVRTHPFLIPACCAAFLQTSQMALSVRWLPSALG
jgi:hypothetical protein